MLVVFVAWLPEKYTYEKSNLPYKDCWAQASYRSLRKLTNLAKSLKVVQDHWTGFDRSHVSFYSSSIVTMAVFCILSEIKPHRPIGRKTPIFVERCYV